MRPSIYLQNWRGLCSRLVCGSLVPRLMSQSKLILFTKASINYCTTTMQIILFRTWTFTWMARSLFTTPDNISTPMFGKCKGCVPPTALLSSLGNLSACGWLDHFYSHTRTKYLFIFTLGLLQFPRENLLDYLVK